MGIKEEIISVAARQIHEKSFHQVGLKSILDELAIPKGSFYTYFKSKEELGLSIIDLYLADTSDCIASLSRDLEGLKLFFSIFFERLRALSLKRGCPVGNMIMELSDENEAFRIRLESWYSNVYEWMASILNSQGIADADRKAKALFAAFEGAMLTAKVSKDTEHFDIFFDTTFDALTRSNR